MNNFLDNDQLLIFVLQTDLISQAFLAFDQLIDLMHMLHDKCRLRVGVGPPQIDFFEIGHVVFALRVVLIFVKVGL